MTSRIPLALTALACAILFASIAAMFVLVLITIVTGDSVNFVGEHSVPDAAVAARAALTLAAWSRRLCRR